MRILLDTNILIYREDNQKVSENLQLLLSLTAEHSVNIVVHPIALAEISRDKKAERREVMLSKIKAYSTLKSPPDPESDGDFRRIVPRKTSPNETGDDHLLCCVFRNAIDFLITNDAGIKDKARRLGIADRVFDIDEAIDFLEDTYKPFESGVTPYSIQELPLHNIRLSDPFFDSLKAQYPEFSDWYARKSREGCTAWIFERSDKSVGAFLMLKDEKEAVELVDSGLPITRRVKIATLKVDEHGHKIGELFIKLAVEYAVSLTVDEMYLTAFDTEANKFLRPLIQEFGFECVGRNKRGEQVFLKRLRPQPDQDLSAALTAYYPSLYDGASVSKYLIPIKPKYHGKLFPEWERRKSAQLPLFAHTLIAEGNSIRKAYLCHSTIKKIGTQDLILFYRSEDVKQITTLCVVEQVHLNQTASDQVIRLTSKRTAYSATELEEQLSKPLLVILFRWHFHFPKPVPYEFLLEGILNGPPQSILELSHEKYQIIKKAGELNESYTFH